MGGGGEENPPNSPQLGLLGLITCLRDAVSRCLHFHQADSPCFN